MSDDRRPASRQGMWFAFCGVMIALGFAASAFLLARSFALLHSQAPPAVDVCSAVFGTSCDAALTSGGGEIAGFPPAGWGIVYYAALAALLGLAWVLGDAFRSEAVFAAMVLSLAGVLASSGFLMVMFRFPRLFCPLCLVVHTVNLLLPFGLKAASGRSIRELPGMAAAGLYCLAGRPIDSPRDARWKAVGLLTAGLIAVIAFEWVYVEWRLRRAAARHRSELARRSVAAYLASPHHDITIRPDDPRLGSDDAAIEIVVFSNFQCVGCKELAPVLRGIQQDFGEQVAVIFKHLPLSRRCNPAVQRELHPESCFAAHMAEAARRAGRFWPFHDALFERAPWIDERVTREAARNVLSQSESAVVSTDSSDRARVAEDIRQAIAMGIDSTPAVFLNGRRVASPDEDVLRLLVRFHLATSPPAN